MKTANIHLISLRIDKDLVTAPDLRVQVQYTVFGE